MTTPTITFGGIASGLNTNALVSGLVAAYQAPENELQSEANSVTSASSTMSTFLANVTALDTAASALSTPLGFNAVSATSTDAGVTATAEAGAAPGSYGVQVLSLAQEQRTESDTESSATDALNMTGTLGIQVGNGKPVSVNVAPTDSLTTIASNINSSGTGVTASVVYTGSQYLLTLRGQTGAANAVTFTENGFSLGLSNPANTYQQASDAQVKIDNTINITSPTNLVTGAIPGVSLALSNKTSGEATVNVTSDPSTLESQLNTFISAYNTVVSSGHTDAGFGSTAATNTLLTGNSSINTTLDTMANIVTGDVPGTTGQYTTLGSVGLTVADDGTLSLDQTTFQTALDTNPSGVEALFVSDPDTGTTGAMGLMTNALDNLTIGSAGALNASIAGLNSEATEYNKELTTMQDQVSAYQTNLQNEFTQLEVSMAKIDEENSAIAAMNSSTSTSSSSTSKGTASVSSSSSSSI